MFIQLTLTSEATASIDANQIIAFYMADENSTVIVLSSGHTLIAKEPYASFAKVVYDTNEQEFEKVDEEKETN